MPYSSYHRKHSEESTGSDSTTNSFVNSDINHKPADLIEPPALNNYHNPEVDSYQENEQVLEERLIETEEINDKQIVEPQRELLDIDSSINLDVVQDSSDNVENCVEESQSKPDLIENDLVNEEICEEENNSLKLPDLTEISQEKSKEVEFDKIGNFDLIPNDTDSKNEIEDKEVASNYSETPER